MAMGKAARAGLTAAAVAAFVSAASAADLVVLESTVPGLVAGDVVSGSEELVLPEGLSLTMISESGEILALSGPYSGVPAAGGGGGDTGLVQQLASLIQSSGTDVSSLGAVRAGDVGGPVEDPWLIDVARPGTHCAPSDGEVRLWRSDPESFDILAMRPSGAEQGGRLTWPEGEAVVPWPAFMGIDDGATFDIVLDERERFQIDLRTLPAELGNDARRAGWMAGNGCPEQALALLRRIAR